MADGNAGKPALDPLTVEFQIARLELEPGDVLVVKTPDAACGLREPHRSEARARLTRTHEMLQALIPGGVRVLFIPPDVELSVLTKAEIEERIDAASQPAAGGPTAKQARAAAPGKVEAEA